MKCTSFSLIYDSIIIPGKENSNLFFVDRKTAVRYHEDRQTERMVTIVKITRRLFRYSLFLLIFAVLLAGCGSQAQVPTDPTEPMQTQPPTEAPTEPGISFSISTKSFAERYGEYYDNKRSFTTNCNGTIYHFDVAIKEPERIEIIELCDPLISLLLEDFPGFTTEDLTLCFRPGDYAPRFLDHSLYIGLDHLNTPEFIIGIAGAIFGEEVNYGLLYAHGTRIAEKAGIKASAALPELDAVLTLCDESPEYLDMNFPCFLTQYADDATLEQVKALALYFYDYLMENQQYDIFTEYSDRKYCETLSAYLVSNGRDGYDNSELQNTVFYYGGPLIRLVWETEDGTFYLEDAFQTQYDMPHLQDRMNSDYAMLRQTIIDYSNQIDYMESLLGDNETDNSEKVDVLFASGHATDRYSLANYNYSENLIRMFCAEPLLHEYGHYLLRETGIESWTNELICYYYSYLPVNENMTYMWSAEVNRYKDLAGDEWAFINSLKEHLGHPVDWTNPDDFIYVFAGYQALYNDPAILTNPDAGAEAKVSFMHYLVGLAGEEAVISAIVNSDPVGTFGKDWPELIDAWHGYIQEEYKWIHKLFYINGGN